MTDFLLEILSEDIPAAIQNKAAKDFVQIALEIFAKNNLKLQDEQVKSFVTPRRLTLYISNLETTKKIPAFIKIGPKIDAEKKAVSGFLKSLGLNDESELKIVENNGQNCYAHIAPETEIKTAIIIENSLPHILQKMTACWPKLMRWDVENYALQPRWIRPVRNILCLFGSEIINCEFAGLKANNLTEGHFLNCPGPLVIAQAGDYQKVLAANFVIADQTQRRQKILDQIKEIAAGLNLETIDDAEKSPLFDEVTGLCEWPTALVANIEEKFMQLPQEVLFLTLKLNQKYFCLKNSLLENSSGDLAPKFIFIADVLITGFNREKIIKDNENLVRARLNDANFFVQEDLKKPLISRVADLKKIVFHQKLGSLYDKIDRMHSLAKFLAIFVPHCDLALVERAANLCKADLTTKIVAELSQLQGKIGSFYAHRQNEDAKIVAAIYEHYLPLGPNSVLPKTALGIVLSISDKIDSIVGFFLVGEKPGSSKDPYALRRAALGIIRIGFEYNIAFPVRILVEKSLRAYPLKLTKNFLDPKKGKFFDNKKILVEEIIKFFVERLKTHLRENELVRPDIVNVVIEEYLANLEAHRYCDILYLAKKIRFLNEFITNKQYQQIIALYKRSANILAIEEKKSAVKFEGKTSFLIFKNKYERSLHKAIKTIFVKFSKLVIKGEFETAFKLLDVLELPLTNFFDHVIVNDQDKNLRENRLLLLAKVRALFNQVADLSKIEIS